MQICRSCVSSILVVSTLLADMAMAGETARCLYVSSYHPEYEWDAGIRKGLSSELAGTCDVHSFFMDTKRNQSEEFAQNKAGEALALIEEFKPDVVIAADDSASLYLVQPHLKNGRIPVVFCGVNNDGASYGYPYQNATGMVEVTPVQPMLHALREIIPEVRGGMFLAADVLSQRLMFERMLKHFSDENIYLQAKFVTTQDEWETVWQAEEDLTDPTDFLFIGNPEGIDGWDKIRAQAFASAHTTKLTLTAWDWLAPMAMLTITKVPEEQGEWAGKVTREILNGTAPSLIPVVTNRRWHMYVNKPLLVSAGIELPTGLLVNAREVDQ